MDTNVPPPISVTDPLGIIVVDHECKRCGYNLRGLNTSSRCPECGTPIGLSVQGDLLRFSDPEWVEKVARGLTIILWMLLVAVLAEVAGMLLGRLVHPIWTQVLTFGAALVSFYGVWLITEPDPSGIGEDPNLTARKVVRIALVIGLLEQALLIATQGLPFGTGFAIVLKVIIAVSWLVALVAEFAKFIYYERLANRIPDAALAGRARFLKWAWTITFGLFTLGAAAFVLFATGAGATVPTGGSALGVAILPVACIALIGALVFGLMTLALLINLRTRITEQAKNARLAWAVAAQETSETT